MTNEIPTLNVHLSNLDISEQFNSQQELDQSDAIKQIIGTHPEYVTFLTCALQKNVVNVVTLIEAKRLFNEGGKIHHPFYNSSSLLEYGNECVREKQKGLGVIQIYPVHGLNTESQS